MAATFQRLSGGRLLLNVVTGGEPTEQRGSATTSTRTSATPAPTSSSPSCAAPGRRRRSTSTASTSRSRAPMVSGAHRPGAGDLLRRLVRPGRAGRGQARRRLPHLGRAAGAGARRRSRWIRDLAARAGPRRPVRHPAAHDLPRHRRGGLGRGAPAARRHRPGDHREGAGRARGQRVRRASSGCSTLHGGSTSYASAHDLEIPPNLWAGVGLVRGGAGTALVGSHEEVADRIEEYHRARHRRVHPLRLPAPRGGVLVRRGRAAPAAPERGCTATPPPTRPVAASA